MKTGKFARSQERKMIVHQQNDKGRRREPKSNMR